MESNGRRGGRRPGAGAKKDTARADLGRRVNLTIQVLPFNVAEQIVQGLLAGDRKNALGLIENMIVAEHRADALRRAEECARLLERYPDLWGVAIPAKRYATSSTPPTAAEWIKETGRAAVLLREIASFVSRRRASAVGNHAFAGQKLTPHGERSLKDESQHAAVARVRQAAQDEREYWDLVFELNKKWRAGELTDEDIGGLRSIAPKDL
jgi:hypothetical protein